ncbi:prophage maintenance system killer protein [Pseudomonas fluorescens]|uniref:hypothetical protein n=1 Tax=Pseudomonas fluorescens TaxID=294 RepID=UPI00209DBF34|nr:hypothetical protein [Pseudomonas fluorescens]MCP1489880.1 prophage maintenance system killer protein [Pseudomonas fluorescens]
MSSHTQGTIAQRITNLLQETGLNNHSTISNFITNANSLVQARPAAERDVHALLKLIDSLSFFIEYQSFESGQTYRPLLDGLWGIADSLSDPYGQSSVSQYKQTLLAGNISPRPVVTAPTETTPPSPDQLCAEQTLQLLTTLYSPILNPAVFIDDYINAGIRRYEQQSGTTSYLSPDSYVRVTYHPGPYDPTLVPPHARAPSIATVRETLRDVVTGHYLYAFKQARDSLGRQYSYPRTTFEPSELISALTQENLQTVMERALSEYRDNPANRTGLTALYQNLIKLRCLAYLDSPNKDVEYVPAVENFLTGDIQAKEVSFNRAKLNGVFLVPSGRKGGVLFDVDAPDFFHVISGARTYATFTGMQTELVSVVPNTTAFKDWLLTKLPSVTAQQYKDSPASVFLTTVISDVNAMPPATWLAHPFSFTSSQNQGDLANKLFDGLMNRLDSDIDYLVFSSWEQTTGHLLEVAKAILTIAAIGLNTVIPGTGTLLSRIGLFLANLALDGAYVAASLTQAHIADRPEDAAAFRNDAILGGILGGVATLASAVPLTRRGITEALALYRRAKSATHTFIPQALRSVTWSRLADNVKINLLVDSMTGSEPARQLARLITPEVVELSMRQNLLLDSLGTAKTRFAWGELAFEQAQVQRRLQSDLTRLSAANDHLRGLLDSPPAVPRQVLPAEAELAAANWITGNSRSAADPGAVSELQERIRNVLSQNRQADLFDIQTVNRLHDGVYQPAAGQVERVFRSSSDPLFMGSDVGRAGFVKALDDIKIKVQAGQVDTGEALFGALVRYHPYGDGNGRTARTLYALAQLNKQEAYFKALTPLAEDMLSGLAPGTLTAG